MQLGAPPGMITLRLAFVAGLVAVLAGCNAPKAPSVQADSVYQAIARKLDPPPPDRARIYVFSGGLPNSGPHPFAGTIYVDQIEIGTVNPKEVMVFDLVPGRHVFRWDTYKDVVTGKPLQYDVTGGTIVLFRTQILGVEFTPMSLPRPGQPADFLVADHITIVRATSCPPNLCL